MDELRLRFGVLLEQTETKFLRYLHRQINWDTRMFSIMGSRGTGKTTLLLQHIKKNLDINKSLFVSADDIYFTENRLFYLAEDFVKYGGKHLIIDEIHKYYDWSREIKMMYDFLPELQVIFTGSSILDIYKGQADLSRRVINYTMHGLSFREFIAMKTGKEYKTYSLEQVLNHKVKISEKPLPLFKEYLETGYYPFFVEENYLERLKNIINITMEVDIPTYTGMNISTARKLKQLLYIIAQNVPFKPNVTKLGEHIGAHRNKVGEYLIFLERAGMINRLMTHNRGSRGLSKIQKIYLNNTNIGTAIASHNQNIGNIRETFFFNQTLVNHNVISSEKSDFQIDDMIFEIGGKNKKQTQIKDAKNGYIVKDDIEYGIGNIIPLWAFGFMY